MAFKSYKQESRKDYGTSKDGALNIEQLQLGALLRIADASEAMAKNHNELIQQVENAKYWRKHYEDLYQSEANSNRTLRGHITKLKKQIAILKAQLNAAG